MNINNKNLDKNLDKFLLFMFIYIYMNINNKNLDKCYPKHMVLTEQLSQINKIIIPNDYEKSIDVLLKDDVYAKINNIVDSVTSINYKTLKCLNNDTVDCNFTKIPINKVSAVIDKYNSPIKKLLDWFSIISDEHIKDCNAKSNVTEYRKLYHKISNIGHVKQKKPDYFLIVVSIVFIFILYKTFLNRS